MSRHFAIATRPTQDDALRAAMISRTVAADAGLREVIAIFRSEPELEALPVIDRDGRPVGAVLERDIRRLLLNPFGHALLDNRSLYRSLEGFVAQVPVADLDTGLAHFFALISDDGGHDALILTEQGRFRGAISGRTLLRMAADREAAVAARRAQRLRRIGEASEAMRAEAAPSRA